MRTLKRPMFKMGGSANEGITSGLDKPKRGLVNEPGSYAGTLEEKFGLSEIDQLVKSRRPKETYKDRDDFLINLGLDMVTRSPSSNIISTIGESVKGPFKQLRAGQALKNKTQSEGESDLFKTLIGAQAKIMGSEGGGKLFSKQQAADAVAGLMGEWQDLRDKQEDMDPREFQDQKAQIFGQIQQYQKENPAISSLFSDKEFTASVKSKIKISLKNSQKLMTVPNPEGEGTIEITEAQYYADNRNANKLQEEIGRRFLEYYNNMTMFGVGAPTVTKAADGGRIGYKRGMAVVQDDERTNYQNGMTAMPAAGDMMQATGNMGPQDDSAPEELTNELTFEELRQRLPQEIGDDIVNLILSSAEAMEDFATIQTEDDISTFNKKYGVNLVLPSEG